MVRSILTVVAIVAGFAFSGVAQAADIPRKAPPQVVVPVYNWTGLYVGAHVGGGWGNSTWFDVGPGAGLVLDTSNRHKMSGGLGGLQIGYNHQVGNWVFGVEGDFSGTGIKGNGLFDPTVGRDPIESKVRWLATFTGRIG